MEPYSIYLHIPFCRSRCGYCDFNTTAGLEAYIPAYAAALCREIKILGLSSGLRLPVHTVYFGGGTPSLVPPEQYALIFSALADTFDLLPQAEISMEANPGTVSLAYLSSLHSLGFNRISFGMQAAHPLDLALLGRRHTFFDTIQAVNWSRQAGFQNLNLDLIFGLPHQPLDRWRENLERALELDPEHLSLYALTLEAGTPLDRMVSRGLVASPDDDLAADAYEAATEILKAAGYRQYEISNWAKTAADGTLLACVHNLQYWRNLSYLGFGAGAHGCAAGLRVANVSSMAEYIRRCDSGREESQFPVGPACEERLERDLFTEMQETLMLGLRLTEEGVSRTGFHARFSMPLETVFQREVDDLQRLGLLEWGGENFDRLRLTSRARLLGNQVFLRFVSNGDGRA